MTEGEDVFFKGVQNTSLVCVCTPTKKEPIRFIKPKSPYKKNHNNYFRKKFIKYFFCSCLHIEHRIKISRGGGLMTASIRN